MTKHFARKVAFSHFLPYGIISKKLWQIAAFSNPSAHTSNDITKPMTQRLSEIRTKKNAAYIKTTRLTEGRYIESATRAYGTENKENFSFHNITPHALYLLTGTLDRTLERKRYEEILDDTAIDSEKKVISYYPNSEQQSVQRTIESFLNISDPTPRQAAAFQELLEKSVMDGYITPLVYAISDAKRYAPTFGTTNGHQLYPPYRLSHINTMMSLAGYLTELDRKPLETGWSFSLKSDCDSNDDCEAETLGVAEICQLALRKWYAEHPDSYLFLDPLKSLSDNYNEWINTPVFYPAGELPGFKPTDIEASSDDKKRRTLRHSCMGIAIGKKENYIIYHLQTKEKRWVKSIEETTVSLVQTAYDRLAISQEKAVMGIGRKPISAIVFFESGSHITPLFRRIKAGKDLPAQQFGYPYVNLYLVPTNYAGVQQLANLLESSPEEYRSALVQTVAERYGAEKTNDDAFPLSLDGLPVFVAHDMDYARLRKAVHKHRNGEPFYIACLPEQVKPLWAIMPRAKYI